MEERSGPREPTEWDGSRLEVGEAVPKLAKPESISVLGVGEPDGAGS